MKTLTEFAAVTLKNAAKTKQELTTAGKTAEELPAAMGEALKVEGDKLTFLMNALEVVGDKLEDLKRVVVFTLGENEKAPYGAVLKGEQHYSTEYYPPLNPPKGKGPQGGGDKGRGGKGGKDGKKGKRGRGGRGGRGEGGGPGRGEGRGPGRGPGRGEGRGEGGKPLDREALQHPGGDRPRGERGGHPGEAGARPPRGPRPDRGPKPQGGGQGPQPQSGHGPKIKPKESGAPAAASQATSEPEKDKS
ncbi:MAG: hypothetical protein ACJ763_12995 [Bdellovibrionia bacterium]